MRRLALALFVLRALTPLPSAAQISPNKRYYTLHTRHFYIHFTRETEPTARRVAVDAERAYGELASELHPPRGPIDVVISDDADYSNGSATPFPTNRIIVYANPPIQSSSLRFTDDWGQMVITHELTHVFHLDRTRGIWALGQYVFGRSPYLFPNEYAPSWLTEGLAVYYESRYTGAGRIEGSEHRMIARAAAIDHTFPALGSVSLATPRFPFGEAAYAYGSLFVDYLARSRGPASVRRFIEKESAELIPYWLDLPAKQGFGISFTRAYRQWRDSIFRSVSVYGANPAPIPGWHDLTHEGIFAYFPRWITDTTLAYTGGTGKEVFGAWRVGETSPRRRIGRRNSESPQARLPNGDLLYAQLDYTSPYEVRSDLYVQHGGHERRLTYGARLSVPDVRGDGAIIAVQTVPGGTRLVRVSADARAITPITGGDLDEQWNEPRWSHRGDRIAAIRWRRTGVSEVVIIDTLGREQAVFASGHSVQATPNWTADDGAVLYSSDRTGTAELYLTTLADGREVRLTDAPAGLFEPEPLLTRPTTADGAAAAAREIGTLAAVTLRGDGYHVGVAPCCATPTVVTAPLVQQGAVPTPPLVIDTSPARPYSPWRQLVPRYWTPSFSQGMNPGQPRIGAETGANDIIDRHAWDLAVAVPTDNSGITGSFAYTYSGLGLPVLDVVAARDWSLIANVYDTAGSRLLGAIRRRIDDGELDATWIRRRYRSAFALVAGTGVEQYRYVGVPNGTIQLVDTTGAFAARFYPRVLLGFGYSRTQAAPFSISPEDGVTLAATARERWRTDIPNTQSFSIVGAGTAYKSLDLPGFAHHVLAFRAAAGWRDDNSTDYFGVGGTSGTPVPIVAGYTVGEGRRDFGVRGFESNSLLGTRALAASAEYRLPLVKPGSSLGMLPLFVQTSSLDFFTDFGSAWCGSVTTKLVCTQALDDRFDLTLHRRLASYGAELNVNAAVLSWDAPYRFRLGIAVPYEDEGLLAPASKVSVYFASGLAF